MNARRIAAALSLSLSILPSLALAKVPPPPPAPAKPVKFPDFAQKTLANGLQVVVIEHHEQPAVSLRMVIPAGKVFEPAAKAGLADATATLLIKGAAGRTSQQIAEEIDFVGGVLGANAGLETVAANALVTSDQLDLGLGLLADVVLRPTFPQDEIDRWRSQTLSGLQIQLEDPNYLADAALVRLVFGDHPFGQPGGGTPETVKGLTRDDVVAFHRRHYLPDGSILAVVGDVNPADAVARVEKAFGGWARGELTPAPKPQVPKRTQPEIVIIDKPEAVQTEISVGQVAIAYRDPDYFVAQVYNSVLGGSARSRLYNEIRKERGLSYGANSFFIEAAQPGWFQAATFTKSETTDEALAVLFDVVEKLEAELVPAEELQAAKVYMTGAFPLEIETPDGIATKVLEALRYGLGKEFLESYNQKLSAVTAEDVKRFAAARIDPDSFVVVLAGNASAFAEKVEKRMGKARVIPYREVDLARADLTRPKQEVAEVSPADAAAALELLKQAQGAMGGKAFVEQKSQVAKGHGTLSPPGGTTQVPLTSVALYRVMPDKERTELALPTGTVVQAYDGTVGWASMMGRTQDVTAQMADRKHFGLDVLRRIDQPGTKVRPAGEETIRDKHCRIVEASDAEGRATRFSVDLESHLVLAVAFTVNGQETRIELDDYRAVGSLQVPHQTVLSQNGQRVVEINLDTVEIDGQVDPGLFTKPAG
jgi:zinc protease